MTTPYVGPISVRMTEGTTIHVRGTTEKHLSGFLISLQCGGGTDPRSDCALAFNPRFTENKVVRNSLQSGSWGPEEHHGSFPFRLGESVEVSIVVHAGRYSVNVDGRPFCDYNHRIPLQRVSHISVEQGIRIREIVFETPMGYPHPTSGYPGIPTGPGGSILNPTTPYVGPISVRMTEGTTIHVRGTSEKHLSGFLISLQCGGSTDPRSDCALAFNPRFTENKVVRNSLQSGSWGPEEHHGSFPFRLGESVEVWIVVHAGHYSVNVDGRPFCDYNHRIPLQRVSHISVEQGIRIREIVFETPMGYPQPTSGYPGIPTGPGGSILNPPMPFIHDMGSLYPGKMIILSGVLHPKPSRFTVNFESTPNGPDIAFHCDFRFNFSGKSNEIVRNTKTNDNWGPEESAVNYFPLAPNAYFEMIFLVEQDSYKLAVNNNHLLDYKHRLQPLNKFTILRMTGDVRITQVRFQ